MPKFLESALADAADKKGLKGEKRDAYIWGTMQHMGLMKGNKETAKGKEMDKKHIAHAALDKVK